MARRRVKKRTHIGANNGSQPNASKSMDKSPKSMVIRIGAGEVGPSITQLVKDMRLVMEPGTASRLKERKSNKLRDYTTMCGPLGVTHLLLFSRSESGNTNLRMAVTPRGPTMHFRVENYSLCRDIQRSQRRPKTSKDLYVTAPLLVMNNFSTSASAPPSSDKPPVPKHLESLVTTMFQSIFPPLNPQQTPLSSIKRVFLLNREPPSDPSNNAYTISLRHYTISSRRTGLTKPIKRLNQAERNGQTERRGKGVPNLGRMSDVSEFLLGGENGTNDGHYTSASESETDTDGEVEVLAPRTKKLLGRQEREKMRAAQENGETGPERARSRSSVEKRAVKLTELGPRMRLRLVKVEEGLCGGKVMWHDYVAKTKAEEKEMEAKWEGKRLEKEERKRIQKENVERKKKDKEARKGGKKGEETGDEDEEMDYDIEDDEYWQDEDDVDGEAGVDDDDEDEDEEMEEG